MLATLSILAATAAGLPSATLPDGKTPETAVEAWEPLSREVEQLLERDVCDALIGNGRRVARYLADELEVVLPAAPEARVEAGGRLWTQVLPVGSPVSATSAAAGEGLEAWLSELAVRTRCSVSFHYFEVSREKPRVAHARMRLLLGGLDRRLEPIQDGGEVSLDLARSESGRWKITRWTMGLRRRAGVPARRFVEVGEAAAFPATFKERSIGGLDDPDRGSIAIGDVDGDGDFDVYLGVEGPNRLYVNLGTGTFAERARSLGLADSGNTRGVLFADLDADGDEDVVIANHHRGSVPGGVEVYENRGTRFRKVFHYAEGESDRYRHISAGDIDGDGDLDFHVCNYGRPEDADSDIDLLDDVSGEKDRLLLNQGDWKWENVAEAWGVEDVRWTYASSLIDLDGDFLPELVVADDFGTKRIYRNVGGERFEDISEAAGLAVERTNGMGVDFGDLDGDGRLDIYFSNMHSNAGTRLGHVLPDGSALERRMLAASSGNTLWMGRESLRFEERAGPLGVADGGWAWGGRFLDVDLDGRLEVASPCGFVTSADLDDG